jgi:hypothetical protein
MGCIRMEENVEKIAVISAGTIIHGQRRRKIVL